MNAEHQTELMEKTLAELRKISMSLEQLRAEVALIEAASSSTNDLVAAILRRSKP